jgi:putative phosphoribosyl transferase
MVYRDRYDAGRRLAGKLERYRGEQPVVLALPRGGVVVTRWRRRWTPSTCSWWGWRSRRRDSPSASRPETTLLNAELIAELGIPPPYVAAVVGRGRRADAAAALPGRPADARSGRTAIPGRRHGHRRHRAGRSSPSAPRSRPTSSPRRSSPDGAAALRGRDDVVCLDCPADFRAVGFWYADFTPTTDAEVIECLRAVNTRRIPA